MSFAVTNRTTKYWGGATVAEKCRDGKRARETRSSSHDSNGCRVETVVTESPDYPASHQMLYGQLIEAHELMRNTTVLPDPVVNPLRVPFVFGEMVMAWYTFGQKGGLLP